MPTYTSSSPEMDELPPYETPSSTITRSRGSRSDASLSRTRTGRDNVRAVAEAMLRASLAKRSAASSDADEALGEPGSPPKAPSSDGTEGSDSTTRRIFTPDSTMSASMSRAADRARLAAAVHLPGSSASAASMMTTTRTRERLRQAEAERDEAIRASEGEKAKASAMWRLAEEERAIAERLKREGEAGPSATEAELRILRLKYDAMRANAKSPRRSTTGLFKKVCSTDLLFLIDTTGSMRSYIDAAKNQVRSVVDDIKVAFLNEVDVRVAVVGYKDHGDDPNIQFLDFTPDVDKVHAFLDELEAVGGDDVPEDVLGGLRQALNASWKHQTRCIVHIADAPPHGTTLHDLDPDTHRDNYSTPGSEPHHLTHGPLLKQMLSLTINYALLRIRKSTDKMAYAFLQAYTAAGASDGKLHKTNRYYSQARTQTRTARRSAQTSKGGLQFEEVELGTTYSALRHLVVRSVTTSASRTAVRMTATAKPAAGLGGKARGLTTLLEGISEEGGGDSTEPIDLETDPPKWDDPDWLSDTVTVEAFSTDVVTTSPGTTTLDDMMVHDDSIKISTTELTIRKRARPFAHGAMRVASYARTAASTNRLVVKSFKKGGKRLADLAEDMRCQALCKAFALEFNAMLGEKYSVDFIVVTCLKPKSAAAGGDECMSLEPFIEGKYVKYNSNCGFVNEAHPTDPFHQAAQAFSHFTYERSRGCFLIADLQGVNRVLTDPAIHTLDPNRFRLADSNLGEEGFKFFFATHKCNDVCRKLRLKSDAVMIVSGRYRFREEWPGTGAVALGSGVVTPMMACCSNKLCSRIVRVAAAKKADGFPGYYWCDGCWPQLESSVVRYICVAVGQPHHEFEVSRFFYESQGQIMPRKCPEHRAGTDFVSRTAAMGLQMASHSEGDGGLTRGIARHVTGGVSIFGSRR